MEDFGIQFEIDLVFLLFRMRIYGIILFSSVGKERFSKNSHSTFNIVCVTSQLLGLPTNPTNKHESFQRVLSSLTRFSKNFSEGLPSQNCSMSNMHNCEVLMIWVTEKKMRLVDIGSIIQFL